MTYIGTSTLKLFRTTASDRVLTFRPTTIRPTTLRPIGFTVRVRVRVRVRVPLTRLLFFEIGAKVAGQKK